jgi:hypothetical protein
MRVTDPTSNAIVAAAPLAQVTATPMIYRPSSSHWFPTVGQLASDFMNKHLSTMPFVVLSAPGLQPLAIGCRDSDGFGARFSWRGEVSAATGPSAYVISGADWLMLVEKLGLTEWLDSEDGQLR